MYKVTSIELNSFCIFLFQLNIYSHNLKLLLAELGNVLPHKIILMFIRFGIYRFQV